MPRRNVSVCTYASWAACISRYMASARRIAPKPRKAISTMSMLKPIASTKREEREYIGQNLDYCDPGRREKYSVPYFDTAIPVVATGVARPQLPELRYRNTVHCIF